MARREMNLTNSKEDTFKARSYLLKHESENALLDPDTLVRRMNESHPDKSVNGSALKVRVSGPVRDVLEFTKKMKVSYPTLKYRIMKNALDRKAKNVNFVSDTIRVYLDF